MKKLTHDYLKECLTYDDDTGIFTWKERPLKHFKSIKSFKFWNTRYANKVAGNLGSDEYISIGICNNPYRAHRLAFLYMEGYMPENVIDHIDQNKSNNKWDNLRHVTQKCNAQNCKLSKNNKSGVTGVSLLSKTKKWQAQIKFNKKNIYLGQFNKLEDAVFARYNEEQSNPLWSCYTKSSAYKWLIKNNLIKDEI